MDNSLKSRLNALDPAQRKQLLARLRALGQLPTDTGPRGIDEDLVLEADIRPQRERDPGCFSDPEQVLVTGATGVVGTFLVTELLERTRADIHCLVRATSPAHAVARLEDTARRYRVPGLARHPRVHVIVGDVSEPRFGLSESAHERLADTVDVIYHAAAELNFLFEYDALRAPNVEGTRHALRLACAGRASALHFVSTTFFFTLAHHEQGPRSFEEDAPLDLGRKCVGGYGRSKWVAESLVHEAHRRGLPGAVFRPSLVLGHSTTGATNLDNVMCRSIIGAATMGAMHDQDFPIDVVSVDLVSAALVVLSLDRSMSGRTFHLTLPERLGLEDVIAALRRRGYAIDRVPMDRWQRSLPQGPRAAENRPIAPLVPFFARTWEQGAGKLSLFELLAAAPPIDCEKTLRALGDRVAIPPLGHVIEATMSYLESVTDLGKHKVG